MLVGHFIFSYLPLQQMADDTVKWYQTLDKNFHWMVIGGFPRPVGGWCFGYGLWCYQCHDFIICRGKPGMPSAASIHTAEMFASGASGYSHYKFGKRQQKTVQRIGNPWGNRGDPGCQYCSPCMVIPIPPYLRPIMACYTMFLGLRDPATMLLGSNSRT